MQPTTILSLAPTLPAPPRAEAGKKVGSAAAESARLEVFRKSRRVKLDGFIRKDCGDGSGGGSERQPGRCGSRPALKEFDSFNTQREAENIRLGKVGAV